MNELEVQTYLYILGLAMSMAKAEVLSSYLFVFRFHSSNTFKSQTQILHTLSST